MLGRVRLIWICTKLFFKKYLFWKGIVKFRQFQKFPNKTLPNVDVDFISLPWKLDNPYYRPWCWTSLASCHASAKLWRLWPRRRWRRPRQPRRRPQWRQPPQWRRRWRQSSRRIIICDLATDHFQQISFHSTAPASTGLGREAAVLPQT